MFKRHVSKCLGSRRVPRAAAALVSGLLLTPWAAANDNGRVVTIQGVGQSAFKNYSMQTGDKIIESKTTLVETAGGHYTAIHTARIRLGKLTTANSYRDPATGAVVNLPEGSTVVPDPVGAPPPPGGAGFRICKPIQAPPGITLPPEAREYIRPPKGAIVNIEGTVTEDDQAAGAPAGLFEQTRAYLASLAPPSESIQLDFDPIDLQAYNLTADGAPEAVSLCQLIGSAEGLADLADWTIGATVLGNDSGDQVVLYSFATVPEPASLLLLALGGALAALRRRRAMVR